MDLDRVPQENRTMVSMFGAMNDHALEAVFEAQGPAANFRFMGNCAYDKGDYDAAITFYNLAINCDDNRKTERVAALANRAQAHLCMKRPDKAVEDAEAVLKMVPNHFKAHFRLGQAFFMKKEFAKAMAHYQKCLAQQKQNPQVKKAIEECQKAMKAGVIGIGIGTAVANEVVGSSSSSSSAASLAPPAEKENCRPRAFSFDQLLMRSWSPMPMMPPYMLTDLNGTEMGMRTLDQVRAALHQNVSKRPIAQIRLEQCVLNAQYIQFFQSLDPSLLDGGALELYGARGSEENIIVFLKLFKPVSLHLASYENYQWDVCNALQNVDTIRLTKHLMLFPRYIESGPGGHHGKMNCAPLTIPAIVRWLHQTPPGGPCAAWNPPISPPSADLGILFIGDTTGHEDLAEMSAHPAAKILLFHSDAFGRAVGRKSNSNKAAQFIEELKKIFFEATSRLNYSVKMMTTQKTIKKYLLFTNALGEQLRVFVQSLTTGLYMETDYFPPHQLIIIERFHVDD